ncbi:ribonuclease H-like domain-containing protein, partial [Tanacetum coccineum]
DNQNRVLNLRRREGKSLFYNTLFLGEYECSSLAIDRRKKKIEDEILSLETRLNYVILSRSSAEADYHSVANVVAETAWICNLLRELYTPLLLTATLVYCDNVSVVYMSANPVQHQRTKHIEIDIHFVRYFVASGQVRVLHVSLRFQYADIFTKGLPTALVIEFRSSLNVRRPPAQTSESISCIRIGSMANVYVCTLSKPYSDTDIVYIFIIC